MNGGEIVAIEQNSIAERAGLKVGDRLITINGEAILDLLDFMTAIYETKLHLTILRDGVPIELKIRKKNYESLGVTFSGVIFDKLKICHNNCQFCFVMQDPPSARETMKIKDDDYRLSFMSGNFISMTNLKESDWEKIIAYHLSPLYISVHATNPELRAKIFKNPKAAELKSQIELLAENGIQIHTQLVLCPGLNDGVELQRSIQELADFYPTVQSIAAVPVGITKFHNRGLRKFNIDEMEQVIQIAKKEQRKIQKKYRENILFLADEFYIETGRELPPASYYNGFPQLENGIGMMRLLLTGFNRCKRFLPEKIEEQREFTFITGMLAKKYIGEIAERFNRTENLQVNSIACKNRFWGETVTTAGLLTGTDILAGVQENFHYKNLLIPELILRDEKYFLDNMSLDELEQKSGCRVIPVSCDFREIKKTVLTYPL